MKNIVLFRLQDDDTMWLVDLEAGTVEPTDVSIEAELGTREDDTPVVRGVDLALAASSRSSVASHLMFPSRVKTGKSDVPQTAGIDIAVAAKARSGAAPHLYFPSR